MAHNGYGSWQARRTMIGEVFGPRLDKLGRLKVQVDANNLVQPISPCSTLDWPKIDESIQQLRAPFRSASSIADYKDVGNRCVGVLEVRGTIVNILK